MSESSSQWEEENLDVIATTLQEAGISLRTDDPTIPLNDIGSMQQRFEEATVVGIGESSHGIRECVRFRHRLLRYLVEELDYRIIGLEVNFSATSELTEYVTTGNGTAREVLSNAGIHPHWQTHAAVDLVEWVRDFNRGRASDDQVRFYGIDVQGGRPTARALATYLEQVDPDFLATVEEELQYVSNEQVNFEIFFTNPEQVDADKYCNICHDLSSTLKSRFAQKEELYIDKSSEREFSRATRQAELLEVAGAIAAERWSDNMGEALELREAGLADNLSWVREREQAEQLVVFAHNLHVNRGGWPVKQWGKFPLCSTVLTMSRRVRRSRSALASGAQSIE